MRSLSTKNKKQKRSVTSKSQPEGKFQLLTSLVINNNPNITETRNTNHKPLDLLILLILNQSTSDVLADKAFLQLKEDYPSYEQILQENNPVKLTQSIKICGLAPSKAKYVLNALHYLKENNWLDINLSFINKLSDEEALKALTKIKGVGVKSASCLLMFSFQRGTFPIDTHLFRILKRVGGIISPKASAEQAHKIIQPKIQGSDSFIVHVGLIELGRNICYAPLKKPLCKECYLNQICDFGLEFITENKL
jgi:endonuclease-3